MASRKRGQSAETRKKIKEMSPKIYAEQYVWPDRVELKSGTFYLNNEPFFTCDYLTEVEAWRNLYRHLKEEYPRPGEEFFRTKYPNNLNR